jgi:hypothetical protein
MAWHLPGGRRTIAVLLVTATVATAVLSIVLPWYAWTNTGTYSETTSSDNTVNVTLEAQVTFNLGNQLQYTSSCPNDCGGTLPDTTESIVFITDYSTVGLNNTGTLYQEMFWLPTASSVFAVAGLGLAVLGQFGRPKAMVPAMMMLIVSVVLALSTPLVLSTSTSNRLLSDHSSATASPFLLIYGGQIPTNGTGPATSYFGSCQGLNCTNPGSPTFSVLFGRNASQTWGPGSGWYVAFASGTLGVLSLFVLIGTTAGPRKPGSRLPKPVGPSTEEAPPPAPPPGSPSEVTPLYPPMYRPPPNIGRGESSDALPPDGNR